MAKAYQPVPLQEEDVSLTSQDDVVNEKWAWESGRRSLPDRLFAKLQRLSPHWAWIAHAVLLSISMTFFALSFCVKSAKNTAADPLPNTYSPALGAIKYEIQHFDLPPVAEGPFIGKGDDVDAMWEYITDGIPDTMISRDEMIKMGLNPEGALEITDPRTGKHGYRVAVEVFHQLHCLNLLRQNNYKSYYRPMGGDTSDEPDDLSGHIDHCIDALRQFVMCQGDVNVFSFRFPFGDGDPWPDYTTPHVCRNFESIRTWAIEHGVPKTPGEPDH